MITYTGKLNFFPLDISKKHKEQSLWKKSALIEFDADIEEYYRYLLKKRFGFNGGLATLRGSHITFINDKVNENDVILQNNYQEIANKYNGQTIDFTIKLNELRSNGYYWWYNVICNEALNIREEIGLERIPYFGLHFTICRFNKDNLSHLEESFRALKNCLFFGI
jgi:hypothetical protein